MKNSELCELRTTIVDNLRGLGKFSESQIPLDSDIPPAKAQSTPSWNRNINNFATILFIFSDLCGLRAFAGDTPGCGSAALGLCGKSYSSLCGFAAFN
jgi:hypothetical protein